jgi:hypothetical protein
MFKVIDARLAQLDRLVLLVAEGRPFEVLEAHRLSTEDESTAVGEVSANPPPPKHSAGPEARDTSIEGGGAANETKPT